MNEQQLKEYNKIQSLYHDIEPAFDINLGDATLPEAIAYFEVKIAKLTKEKLLLRTQNAKLKNVLYELCAHAEPVCDTLEMERTLISKDTLKNFRRTLNDGRAAL